MQRRLTHLAKEVLPFELRYAVRRLNWQRRYLMSFVKTAAGERVMCPIADREFRHFAISAKGRPLTPSNGAQPRHRLIWLYLQRQTQLFNGGRSLLHVAPERCLLERFANMPGLLYVPGDKMARGYGKQAGVRQLDILAIDFPSDVFDFVLCNHVLEHIVDERAALSELFRVLKPGGKLIVTVPMRKGPTLEDPEVTTPRQRELLFGQWDHVRYYGDDIGERLQGVGFDAELVNYAEALSEEERRRFGVGHTTIVVGNKP